MRCNSIQFYTLKRVRVCTTVHIGVDAHMDQIQFVQWMKNCTMKIAKIKMKRLDAHDESQHEVRRRTFVHFRCKMYFGKMLLPLELKMIKKLKFRCAQLRHKNHLVPLQMCFVGRDSISWRWNKNPPVSPSCVHLYKLICRALYSFCLRLYVCVCVWVWIRRSCVLVSGFCWSLIVIASWNRNARMALKPIQPFNFKTENGDKENMSTPQRMTIKCTVWTELQSKALRFSILCFPLFHSAGFRSFLSRSLALAFPFQIKSIHISFHSVCFLRGEEKTNWKHSHRKRAKLNAQHFLFYFESFLFKSFFGSDFFVWPHIPIWRLEKGRH